MLALRRLEKSRYSVKLTQSIKTLSAACKYLVNITLMTHIKHNVIIG